MIHLKERVTLDWNLQSEDALNEERLFTMSPSPAAGNTHLHRFEIHKRFKHRLNRTPGVTRIETQPSPMRPIFVRAVLDTRSFFQQEYTPSTAHLELEWRPHFDQDKFRIQYTEPGEPWSCGWHQDDTHDELGASHFQVDHSAWKSSIREPASFTDPNPMAILETCIEELLVRVPSLPDSIR
jgi:hypothetical protein